MPDFYTGSVPASGDTSNVRDAFYRSMRLQSPMEVVLTRDLTNTVNTDFAIASGYFAGGLPGQNTVDNTSLYVLGRYYHAVQVYSAHTSAISIQMEGSLDGVNWASIGSAITGAGITTFTGVYKYIRAHVATVTLTGGPDYTDDYGVRVVYISLAQQ